MSYIRNVGPPSFDFSDRFGLPGKPGGTFTEAKRRFEFRRNRGGKEIGLFSFQPLEEPGQDLQLSAAQFASEVA